MQTVKRENILKLIGQRASKLIVSRTKVFFIVQEMDFFYVASRFHDKYSVYTSPLPSVYYGAQLDSMENGESSLKIDFSLASFSIMF